MTGAGASPPGVDKHRPGARVFGRPLTRVSVRSLVRTPATVAVASVVILALTWELVGRQFPDSASYPSAVLAALAEITGGDGELLSALGATLQGMLVGFLVAAVLGVTTGFTMGRLPVVAGLVEPYINAIYATPRIALIPLLVLWFGIGFELRVTVTVLVAIFPIIVNTYMGASTVEVGLMDAGRSFNANSVQLLRTVVIPASLPYVLTGLRIGAFRSLVGVIVAEMTASVSGTGQLLITYGNFLDTPKLVATILSLGLIGVLITKLMGAGERIAMPWTRLRR